MIFSKGFVQPKIFIMETMINLSDLLKHEIMDLYSAEEQIIEAMPAMIEKAKNPELKKALQQHLKITEEQKSRLDKVKATFGTDGEEGGEGGEKKGFFSRLFGGSGGEKCRGMEGLITEGEKMMAADITDEALDSAIIASAQKIEHYEISGYGTARAFARELKLVEVERLLEQTLNEEYIADDMLTSLAVGKLNLEAEQATGMENGSGRSSSSKGASKGGSSKGSSSKGGSKGGSSKGGNSSKGGSSKGGSSKGGSSKGGSSKGGSSKGGSSKGGSSKGGSSKGGSSKGGSSKGGNSKGGGSKGGSSKGGSSKGGSKSGSRGR
jgi:ferritin-like metal-binding protein YciE